MKNLNKKKWPAHLPEDFFERQAKLITQKTTELENWQLPHTKNYESYFPLKPNFWLEMESHIQHKTIHPKSIFNPVSGLHRPVFALTLAACVSLLLVWGVLILKNTQNMNQNVASEVETADLIAFTEAAGLAELQNYNEILTSEQQDFSLLNVPYKIPETSVEDFALNISQTDPYRLLSDSF